MARLSYVAAASAPNPVREGLEAAPDLNIFKLVAHASDAFVPWLRFGAAVLGALSVDPVLRELAILRVAALTPGAEYEWVQHEAIARAVGMTDAQVQGARSGTGLDGDDALVAAFTEQVVRDATPDDATFTAMRGRFSERELVELLLVIGQYMLVARVMATAQIDPEPALGAPSLEKMTAQLERERERGESST